MNLELLELLGDSNCDKWYRSAYIAYHMEYPATHNAEYLSTLLTG